MHNDRVVAVTLIVLAYFSVLGSVSHAETFTFAVSENEPPLSEAENSASIGIIPDIIRLVFRSIPELEVKVGAYPWARAQNLVEQGSIDGLMTYPSEKRKDYAVFSDNYAYKLDFGYLIFHKENTDRAAIESARGFDSLRKKSVITQTGAEWESDNIPDFMTKIEANNVNTMFHLLLLRRAGDFLIMPPEQATYIAKKLGYQDQLAYQHVDFIPNALIPFHIGLRKTHPSATSILKKVSSVISSERYQNKLKALIRRYR